jgi:peptidoglycan/xylan/chitin deacetylase (PgdA/CDA1 family)
MSSDWPLILAYHHIVTHAPSRYTLDATSFEARLDRMLHSGYKPLTLETALAAGPFGSGSAAPKTFTITFDDALESFYTLAIPVLRRLNLLAQTTLFVPTAFVGKDNAWSQGESPGDRDAIATDPPEAIMTWEQLAEAAEAGVSIQSHGHRHLPMNKTEYDDALADSKASMNALHEHGFSPRYLALPFGWHSPEAKRAIAEAGFDAALSVTWGGRDRYEVRRIPIYGTDAAPMRWLKLSGRYFDTFDAAAAVLGRRRS